MTCFQFVIGDTGMILWLHLGLLLLVLYAIWKSFRMKRDGASVKRSPQSWNYFYLAYGVLSVIVTQVISLSEFGKGYKVVIAIVDLGTLLYLGFFNSWFRNTIMRFVVQSQNKEE